jgi:PncC family amidohydrolase
MLYELDIADQAIEVFNILNERKETVATAESATAGLIAYLLTTAPGSSNVFKQGWVLYQESAKRRDFQMPMQVEVYSAECGRYLAEEARIRANTTWGIGITGLADQNKAWVSVSHEGGVLSSVDVRSREFGGNPVSSRRGARYEFASLAIKLFLSVLKKSQNH